jgi:hypothetical protein
MEQGEVAEGRQQAPELVGQVVPQPHRRHLRSRSCRGLDAAKPDDQ